MNIGLVAHDTKKMLMQNFCIAYRGILARNELYATGTTGRLIEEVTNLNIHKFLAGHLGGEQQLGAQIEHNNIDLMNRILKQIILQTFIENQIKIISCCIMIRIIQTIRRHKMCLRCTKPLGFRIHLVTKSRYISPANCRSYGIGCIVAGIDQHTIQ